MLTIGETGRCGQDLCQQAVDGPVGKSTKPDNMPYSLLVLLSMEGRGLKWTQEQDQVLSLTRPLLQALPRALLVPNLAQERGPREAKREYFPPSSLTFCSGYSALPDIA